jgi:hypothetical protein
MLDRTERRLDLRPKQLAANTAYGTGKSLGWLVKEKKIIPNLKLQQPQLPRSEPDEQPNESSQLGEAYCCR